MGKLPHGIWPSGDGSRVYVGLENADALAAIDTLSNRVIATVPIGQAPQAVTYVPNAVPEGDGKQGLQALGIAGQTTHLALAPLAGGKPSVETEKAPTSVTWACRTIQPATARSRRCRLSSPIRPVQQSSTASGRSGRSSREKQRTHAAI